MQTVEEAATAEEAEIDFTVAAHDLPKFRIEASLNMHKIIYHLVWTVFM